MKLYFGNMVTTVTTLMILSLVGFIGYSINNRYADALAGWTKKHKKPSLTFARNMAYDIRSRNIRTGGP